MPAARPASVTSRLWLTMEPEQKPPPWKNTSTLDASLPGASDHSHGTPPTVPGVERDVGRGRRHRADLLDPRAPLRPAHGPRLRPEKRPDRLDSRVGHDAILPCRSASALAGTATHCSVVSRIATIA